MSAQHRGPSAVTRPIGVVLMDAEATMPLLERLRGSALSVGPVLRWGSPHAYSRLLSQRPPLILLDLPTPVRPGTLVALVRAASVLAPVVVLAPRGVDVAAGLNAGALDVLVRSIPIEELTARIRARLRRLTLPAPRPDAHPSARLNGAQLALANVIAAADRPVCCHELRLLFGTPDRPLPVRALRARLRRLAVWMHANGLHIETTARWGYARYSLVPTSLERTG